MKRLLDILIALILLIAALPVFAVVSLAIVLTSRGSPLHVSKRVGKDNVCFNMFKFRTMRTDTPQVATHLMTEPGKYVTPVGRILRKTSLDELPQLLNVLKGDMSFVGPRPALYNQDDLVALRTEKGVHKLIPGVTGWAQVNGRDDISIPEKVVLDEYYLKNRSLLLDFRIILKTVANALCGKGVSH